MTDLIAVQRIAGWEKLKTLVLDSVSSPITKRVYNMALDEFLGWFQQAPRPGFTKATVSAWRVSLEARGLGSSSIIIRMSAIRKLATEAADKGLLAPELAAGIAACQVRALPSRGKPYRVQRPSDSHRRRRCSGQSRRGWPCAVLPVAVPLRQSELRPGVWLCGARPRSGSGRCRRRGPR
jgi:integrase family protein with SAM-like domain